MTLHIAGDMRKNGRGEPMFTQLSEDFTSRAEASFLQLLRGMIHRHPSVGKTLK